ncbi:MULTISPECIES: ArsR family transcriptional regulator [unclassified Pseudomonas]|uniref:ArsR family transcriptional regulator n=1 Tax=unclassified Pseudomonas TaxID=196821 RepID=UPI0035C06C8E
MSLPNEILQLLECGEALGSREIALRLDVSWPTVKRHLAVLLDAGRSNGREMGAASGTVSRAPYNNRLQSPRRVRPLVFRGPLPASYYESNCCVPWRCAMSSLITVIWSIITNPTPQPGFLPIWSTRWRLRVACVANSLRVPTPGRCWSRC